MTELGVAESHALGMAEGLHCSCDVLKQLWIYSVDSLIQPDNTKPSVSRFTPQDNTFYLHILLHVLGTNSGPIDSMLLMQIQ